MADESLFQIIANAAHKMPDVPPGFFARFINITVEDFGTTCCYIPSLKKKRHIEKIELLKDLSSKEISKRLNITQSRVRQLMRLLSGSPAPRALPSCPEKTAQTCEQLSLPLVFSGKN